MKQIFILLISFLGLSACSMPFEEPIHTKLAVPFASNNKTQYLDSKNAPDLVVEPGLTTSNLSGFYRLPSPPKNPKVDVLPPVT
ncbi:MAG: hypothetical protein QNK11_00160 [Legionella sp.]|nr:hypothetical protein [Legionella sp.]